MLQVGTHSVIVSIGGHKDLVFKKLTKARCASLPPSPCTLACAFHCAASPTTHCRIIVACWLSLEPFNKPCSLMRVCLLAVQVPSIACESLVLLLASLCRSCCCRSCCHFVCTCAVASQINSRAHDQSADGVGVGASI